MFEMYKDKKDSTFYYTGSIICVQCKKEAVPFGYLLITHVLKSSSFSIEMHCVNCIQKIKDKIPSRGKELYHVKTVFEELPVTCVPVLLMPMELINKNDLTVLDAATRDGEKKMASDTSAGVHQINHCNYAFGPSIEGAQVGKSESQVDLECGNKRKQLSAREVDEFLLGARDVVPMIDDEKKMRLE
jgi:hypothetical protein